MSDDEKLKTEDGQGSSEGDVYDELKEARELQEKISNLHKIRKINEEHALRKVVDDKGARSKLTTLSEMGPSFYPGAEAYNASDHTLTTQFRAGFRFRGKAIVRVGVEIERDAKSQSLKPVVMSLTTELPRTYMGDPEERITVEGQRAIREVIYRDGKKRRVTIDLLNGLYIEELVKIGETNQPDEILSRTEKKMVKDGSDMNHEQELSESMLKTQYLELLEKQAEILG